MRTTATSSNASIHTYYVGVSPSSFISFLSEKQIHLDALREIILTYFFLFCFHFIPAEHKYYTQQNSKCLYVGAR